MTNEELNERLAAAKRLVAALERLKAANSEVAEAEFLYEKKADEIEAPPETRLTLAKFKKSLDRVSLNERLREYISAKKPTVKQVAKAALALLGPLSNPALLEAILAHGYPGLRTMAAADSLRGSLWHLAKSGEVVKNPDLTFAIPEGHLEAVLAEVA